MGLVNSYRGKGGGREGRGKGGEEEKGEGVLAIALLKTCRSTCKQVNSVQRLGCAYALNGTFFGARKQQLFFISPMTYMGDSGRFQADSPSL